MGLAADKYIVDDVGEGLYGVDAATAAHVLRLNQVVNDRITVCLNGVEDVDAGNDDVEFKRQLVFETTVRAVVEDPDLRKYFPEDIRWITALGRVAIELLQLRNLDKSRLNVLAVGTVELPPFARVLLDVVQDGGDKMEKDFWDAKVSELDESKRERAASEIGHFFALRKEYNDSHPSTGYDLFAQGPEDVREAFVDQYILGKSAVDITPELRQELVQNSAILSDSDLARKFLIDAQLRHSLTDDPDKGNRKKPLVFASINSRDTSYLEKIATGRPEVSLRKEFKPVPPYTDSCWHVEPFDGEELMDEFTLSRLLDQIMACTTNAEEPTILLDFSKIAIGESDNLGRLIELALKHDAAGKRIMILCSALGINDPMRAGATAYFSRNEELFKRANSVNTMVTAGNPSSVYATAYALGKAEDHAILREVFATADESEYEALSHEAAGVMVEYFIAQYGLDLDPVLLQKMKENAQVFSGGMLVLNTAFGKFAFDSLFDGKQPVFEIPVASFGSAFQFLNQTKLGRKDVVVDEINVQQKNALHMDVNDVVKIYNQEEADGREKRRIYYITQVGNPNGTAMNGEQLYDVCEKIVTEDPEALIVLDSVYAGTLPKAQAKKLFEKLFANEKILGRVFWLNSLSKVNGLCGLRGAVGFSTSPEVAKACNDETVKAPMSVLARASAVKEYDESHEEVRRQLLTLWQRERRGLYDYLVTSEKFGKLIHEDQSHLDGQGLDYDESTCTLYLCLRLQPGVNAMDVLFSTGCLGVPQQRMKTDDGGIYLRLAVGGIQDPTFAKYISRETPAIASASMPAAL